MFQYMPPASRVGNAVHLVQEIGTIQLRGPSATESIAAEPPSTEAPASAASVAAAATPRAATVEEADATAAQEGDAQTAAQAETGACLCFSFPRVCVHAML